MITTGTKLGPYEILSALGAGGMGEVYRARDTRLDRTVAVKVLSQHLSQNPEARERFEREARAISSLSHPNICHLYDVGEQAGTSFLVMEYLDGETLSDRLSKGPLPLEQVLKLGMEICEGLEKAHRNGVVHRDLKPGNIMLTKSGAKLMDFGLAKAMPQANAPASSLTASLAHAGQPLTAQGTVVGTFQYMSPEQLDGKEADVRSDIFAFGAVLYEMVTGKRAFEGNTMASTIAAILAAEPKPISQLQPMSPPALERLVKGCLAKDPEERLQTSHDVKLQLKWMLEGSSTESGVSAPAISRRSRWDRLGWLLTAVLLLIVIGGGAAWWLGARNSPRAMYFNSYVPFPASDVALSPDGGTVAFVAFSDQNNKYVLWTHAVGSRSAVSLPGTEDASHPFWSPDSRSIGFFAQGKLKSVDVASGRSAQALCDARHGRGGAWNRDGVILFTPDVFGGINQISASGGTPKEITKPDRSLVINTHRWPVFLPDGRHFLFLAASFGGDFEKNTIMVGSLDSAETHSILSASSNAAYAEPGYLLYMRDNALVAQKFDVHTYTLSGEPRTISDGVQYFPQIGLGLFSVAGRTLILQTGKGAGKSQLLWFDRSGKQVGAVGPAGPVANPSLSPDGRRVAFEQVDHDGRHVDVWVRELATDAVMRLTFGPGLNELPVWSPDGVRIAFTSNEKAQYHVHQKNADGSGPELQVVEPSETQQGAWDWSHDGKTILIWKVGQLWSVTMPDQPKPYIQGNWLVRNARFSPDGKWVAYASNETGSWEVYVSPFPNASSKWQVSSGGGEEPRWRRDGKELFYLSADRKMMAVSVKTSSTFESGSPTALFQTHLHQPISSADNISYDVSADGQKFLVNTKVDEPSAAPLSVILDWASEMER